MPALLSAIRNAFPRMSARTGAASGAAMPATHALTPRTRSTAHSTRLSDVIVTTLANAGHNRNTVR
ncbi:hypothetical protein MPRS_04560 [Mycobacterium paraseoulense]|nr:hypothetical protein MPRS_04560 [Mycobacterium paraseoulense]